MAEIQSKNSRTEIMSSCWLVFRREFEAVIFVEKSRSYEEYTARVLGFYGILLG